MSAQILSADLGGHLRQIGRSGRRSRDAYRRIQAENQDNGAYVGGGVSDQGMGEHRRHGNISRQYGQELPGKRLSSSARMRGMGEGVFTSPCQFVSGGTEARSIAVPCCILPTAPR